MKKKEWKKLAKQLKRQLEQMTAAYEIERDKNNGKSMRFIRFSPLPTIDTEAKNERSND